MAAVLCVNIGGADPDLYQALYGAVSESRRQRADSCKNRDAALRCLAAGALLRFAVGTACFEEETDPMGKPRIRGREDICFNLSHSGPWVVIAYGSSPVGVDVETRNWNPSAQKVVKRFFSPEEQAFVLETERNCRERFLQVWTSKESYLKYLGTGLRYPLQSFCVLSEPLRAGFASRQLVDGAWVTLYSQDREADFQSITLQHLINAI